MSERRWQHVHHGARVQEERDVYKEADQGCLDHVHDLRHVFTLLRDGAEVGPVDSYSGSILPHMRSKRERKAVRDRVQLLPLVDSAGNAASRGECVGAGVLFNCRIGQTAQLLAVDSKSLKNVFVYPEPDKRVYAQQQAQTIPSSLVRRQSYSNGGLSSQTGMMNPSQKSRLVHSAGSSPLLHNQQGVEMASKRTRMNTEMLPPTPSFWDGNTFTCSHTRIPHDDNDALQSFSRESVEDGELIARLLNYVNQKGFLKVDVAFTSLRLRVGDRKGIRRRGGKCDSTCELVGYSAHLSVHGPGVAGAE